jgi:hypothetical protein
MGGDLMAREWNVPGYTEVRTLGSGGFGDVVLARHDASGTLVAIKYLRRELLADPEFAGMFRAEAGVLASLNDPNVVRLYEYVESPGGAAIVMELVEGVSLREILSRQGKTTPEAALVVLQGSLLGLAAVHQRGVVHRDYKPENVLIDGAGASKLTDFGIAARAGQAPVPAGTLMYAPPEQFAGSPASPATDVYAATATFYECLTGSPPFTGNTAELLMRQHLADPVPLEPVPASLRALVAAGLAKDPNSRPADGAALVAGLRTAAGEAYGPDWEQRGRSQLAGAALLLAAMWPSAGTAAVQATSVHKVSLLRRLRPRHIGPVKGAVAGGVAIAVVAAVVVVAAAQPRSREAPKGPAKEPTATAEPTAAAISGHLALVAAASDRSAWALGCTGTPCILPFMVRWNGTTWTHVPILGPDPGYLLLDMAAAPDGSAWAVGYTGNDSDNGTGLSTVILRWNGTAWMRVPSPSPGPSSHLSSVTVISADSAWAIGVTTNGSGNEIPLILRWNGTTWTRQPTPGSVDGSLYGIDAVSASDIWAFGQDIGSATRIPVLIMRWNGVTWTQVPSPSPGTGDGIFAMAAASADSAWAVGFTQSSTGDRGTLSLRWNGTAWTVVPNPSPAGTTLDSVAALPDGTAWAVGATANGAGSGMLMLRWNGAAWTRVPLPDPAGSALSGVTALSDDDAWAVGYADGKALIMRWDGQKWSVVAGQLVPAAAATSSPAPGTAPSPAPDAAPTAVPSPASSAVTSPATPTRQQAARDLAGLLAQSGTDRAGITQAFNAVAACSSGLSQDETIFSTAAASRQTLLAALPDSSALPAAMLRDLTMAWQVSGEADQDFADWTQDEISRGCSTNYKSDANYQAAVAPDNQATADKKAFVALWTPIAEQYGLPVYQYGQL